MPPLHSLLCTVWIITVVTLLLSVFLLSLGFYALNKIFYLFELLLYFYGCLIDEVSTVPEKLSNFVPIRFINIPWLLIGALLSSCYLSIFITNLNSPLPGERVDSYEKISCQDNPQIIVNSTMIRHRTNERRLLEGEHSKNLTIPPFVKGLGGFCYTVLSEFVPNFWIKYYVANFKFSKFYSDFNYKSDNFPPHLQRLLYFMLNSRIRKYPEKLRFSNNVTTNEVNRLIEEEILQCERSAYIGPSSEVNAYYDYLTRNYPTKSWYRGEKTIFESLVGFTLRVGRESRMVRYFKMFLDAGIYSQVANQVALDATLLRERKAKFGNYEKFRYATSFQAVRLGDSIQTTFILLTTCLAVCFCGVVVEYASYNGTNIIQWDEFTFIWGKFMKSAQQFVCHKK
ncbi:uncharacterized protein LOC110857739 [Folsomia candida]|uniref:uncharacterized protein LOC110857739 n=1 Tax=Folsomia candida TaxID=158441 RepID=UPI0016052518|nr:uncharacterized protein LOC110857739 [Folsomia candida]